MIELRCLCLDDEVEHYQVLKQTMEEAFRNTNVKVELEHFHDPRAVMGPLRAKPYHLLFADLYYYNEITKTLEKTKGLNAIARAAQEFKNLVIIALSQDSDVRVRDEVLKNGGYQLMTKAWLMGNPDPKEFRTAIEEAVADRLGLLLTAPKVAQPAKKDPRLETILKAIGPTTLEVLLRQLIPNWEEIDSFVPGYIAAGYSGAYVLKLDLFTAGRQEGQLLLKISRDKAPLAHELKEAPKAGQLDYAAYAAYQEEREVKSHGGWHAIYAAFLGGSVTFEKWVLDSEYEPDPATVLKDLFSREKLGKVYKSWPVKKEGSVLDHLFPSQVKTAVRILDGMELLSCCLEKRGFQPDRLLLERFVMEKKVGKRKEDSIRRGTFTLSKAHGDMHPRNIMVSIEDGKAQLIDTGSREERYCAADLARLCASLWVTVWDWEDQYFWENLGIWRAQVKAWRTDQNVDPLDKKRDPRVWSALSHLRTVGPDLLGEKFEQWQFDLALALEFLKHSSYPDWSVPKRCLAFLAAQDLLTDVEEQLPDKDATWTAGEELAAR